MAKSCWCYLFVFKLERTRALQKRTHFSVPFQSILDILLALVAVYEWEEGSVFDGWTINTERRLTKLSDYHSTLLLESISERCLYVELMSKETARYHFILLALCPNQSCDL